MQWRATPEQYRLVGEDTPRWVALGLLFVGLVSSVAVAWLLMSIRPALSPPDAVPAGEAGRASAPHPPDAPTTLKPVPPLVDVIRGAYQPLQRSKGAKLEEGRAGAEQTVVRPPAEGAPPEAPAPRRGSATQTRAPRLAPPPLTAPDCPARLNVKFERGGDVPLGSNIEGDVAALRDWVQRHPAARLLVEGHSDAWGPEEVNMMLSYHRASAVAAKLIAAGVPAAQVTTQAFGETAPLPGIPPGSSQNRRVVIRVGGVQGCED